VPAVRSGVDHGAGNAVPSLLKFLVDNALPPALADLLTSTRYDASMSERMDCMLQAMSGSWIEREARTELSFRRIRTLAPF
jgi:hypothetical protein